MIPSFIIVFMHLSFEDLDKDVQVRKGKIWKLENYHIVIGNVMMF